MSWWQVVGAVGLGGVALLGWSAVRLGALSDTVFYDEHGQLRRLVPCDDPSCPTERCRPLTDEEQLLAEQLDDLEPLSEAIVRRDIAEAS